MKKKILCAVNVQTDFFASLKDNVDWLLFQCARRQGAQSELAVFTIGRDGQGRAFLFHWAEPKRHHRQSKGHVDGLFVSFARRELET
jgi:hypothetical protein